MSISSIAPVALTFPSPTSARVTATTGGRRRWVSRIRRWASSTRSTAAFGRRRLLIYAVTDTVSQLEPWQREDRERIAGQQEVIRGTEFVERKLRSQFRDQVRNGFVVEIHGGHHWIFVSHREEVLSAVRRFLLTGAPS